MSIDTSKMVFVFGSNMAGIHGAGAARFAKQQRGAVMGVGYGLTGQSFAIPTKDRFIHHPILNGDLDYFIKGFIAFAVHRPDLQFQVTRIGCGLAGMKDEEVAEFFTWAPENCWFDIKWKEHMAVSSHGPDLRKYWGTF